jgi:chloramphenicol O-acetyltransferase type A
MQKLEKIDLENWERKEQYHFFRNYDNPFFSLTASVDVTRLLAYTKKKGYSFFAAYLFASQQQVNHIPEFRYRIKGDDVVIYPTIVAGSTVLKANNVFIFCYFDHLPSFRDFNPHVLQRVADSQQPGTKLVDHDDDLAQVHYSVIPWIHFSGLGHPRKFGTDDSVPKIVFGKYENREGKMMMPISVDGHHSLLDGYHVGLYFDGLQKSINDPETLLES